MPFETRHPNRSVHGKTGCNGMFRWTTSTPLSFDFAVYPGELHYFHREQVIRDAWRRAEAFFDRELR